MRQPGGCLCYALQSRPAQQNPVPNGPQDVPKNPLISIYCIYLIQARLFHQSFLRWHYRNIIFDSAVHRPPAVFH